jgi:hypothetical protein
MTVHEPCWHDYLDEAAEKEVIIIGSHISFLPRLENLTLDFNAQHDEMSFSSIQNHFHWQNPNAFPALESITLLNTVNFQEDYNQIPCFSNGRNIFVMEPFHTSGYALWNGLALMTSHTSFPMLQHWKLQVEADWIEHNSETYFRMKKAVHGSLRGGEPYTYHHITDEQGRSFLDCVPSRPLSVTEE